MKKLTDLEVALKLEEIAREEPKPHSFCETPKEKCTMNYCDENGCVNRKRFLVEEAKHQTQGYDCPRTKKQCDDECCVSAENCHINTMGHLLEVKQVGTIRIKSLNNGK